MNWTERKEQIIQRAEVITDLWEITKIYTGRLAEWILFLCMIANILEILPGVALDTWFTNLVLGVQVVTLDVAGFGLASMANHAQIQGDMRAAKKAKYTAWFLIGLMIVTLLNVTAGLLYPGIKQYTDMADKIFILVRVVMMVIYGHVIHNLRRSGHQIALQQSAHMQIDIAAKVEETLRQKLADFQQEMTTTFQQKEDTLSSLFYHQNLALSDTLARAITPLVEQIGDVQNETPTSPSSSTLSQELILPQLNLFLSQEVPEYDTTFCEFTGEIPALSPAKSEPTIQQKVTQVLEEKLPHVEADVAAKVEEKSRQKKYVMTLEEAATFTGLSVATLKKKIREKQIRTSSGDEGKVLVSSLANLQTRQTQPRLKVVGK